MIRPTNPRVKRRLFDVDESTEQAIVNNVANIIQESIAKERTTKSLKWNFDFENELPLEGTYEWFKKDNNEWIGMKLEQKENEKETEKEKDRSVQNVNEATPKTNDGKIALLLKKRSRITENVPERAVRRKISFQ